MLHRIFVLALLLLLIGDNRSALAMVPLKQGKPDRVEVGVWLGGIHNVNMVDGDFRAELYIWWIGNNPDFRPFDVFQVLNGRDWTVRAESRRRLADGRYHTSGFVSVTVSHNWDLRYYPFDSQTLKIVIETPYTASELRLVPSRRRSTMSDFLEVEGFEVSGIRLHEHIEGYNTDFGIPENAGDKYSRLILEVQMERKSDRLAVVLLLGFIVANLIALFTFAIEVSMIGTRAAMITAAVFGAIGNMSLVSGRVNPAVGSVVVDGFALGTFASILVALLIGIIVNRLARWEKVRLARTINWSCFSVVLVASVFYYKSIFDIALR